MTLVIKHQSGQAFTPAQLDVINPLLVQGLNAGWSTKKLNREIDKLLAEKGIPVTANQEKSNG